MDAGVNEMEYYSDGYIKAISLICTQIDNSVKSFDIHLSCSDTDDNLIITSRMSGKEFYFHTKKYKNEARWTYIINRDDNHTFIDIGTTHELVEFVREVII